MSSLHSSTVILDEVIYMMIPEGLRTPQNEGMVCKLLNITVRAEAISQTMVREDSQLSSE